MDVSALSAAFSEVSGPGGRQPVDGHFKIGYHAPVKVIEEV
jgi:hypothetical protein